MLTINVDYQLWLPILSTNVDYQHWPPIWTTKVQDLINGEVASQKGCSLMFRNKTACFFFNLCSLTTVHQIMKKSFAFWIYFTKTLNRGQSSSLCHALWANLPLNVMHDVLWAQYLWANLSLAHPCSVLLSLSLAFSSSFQLTLGHSGSVTYSGSQPLQFFLAQSGSLWLTQTHSGWLWLTLTHTSTL